MKSLVRAWIKDGKIYCLSQMCDNGHAICPNINTCPKFYISLEKELTKGDELNEECKSSNRS